MTTALICAMPMELAPLVKKLGLKRVSKQRATGERVVALYTGMGTALATKSTEALFADFPNIERVVVFGITGGVDNDTEIGALVVPEKVRNSETGEDFTPHDACGHVPKGIMWTTNVITPPHELPPLLAQGVVSLDMETAAIAKACEDRGIPWSVFRTVSDRPDSDITDEVFKLAHQDGSINWQNVAKFFLTKPYKIPAMMKLMQHGRLATNNAADAAIAAYRAGA
jgi:adenosylhomocysteine nucleosidase